MATKTALATSCTASQAFDALSPGEASVRLSGRVEYGPSIQSQAIYLEA
jgi:hypothetical protein